jgi:hypothetical protein
MSRWFPALWRAHKEKENEEEEKKPPEPLPAFSPWQHLPTALVQCIAAFLPIRDVMGLRRTSRTTYAVTFIGHHHVRIGRLLPGALSYIQQQRRRITRLTMNGAIELDALAELHTLRDLKQLDIEAFQTLRAVSNDTYQQVYQRWFDAMALGLERLVVCSYDAYDMALLSMVLARNCHTLRHVHIDGCLYAEWPSEAVAVLQGLTSFSTSCAVPGLSYAVSDRAIERAETSNILVHIDLIDPQNVMYEEYGHDEDEEDDLFNGSAILPWHLADTLRIASLLACRDSVWVCPPHVEFLHVRFSQHIKKLLPRHLPASSCAHLMSLILDLAYYNRNITDVETAAFSTAHRAGGSTRELPGQGDGCV